MKLETAPADFNPLDAQRRPPTTAHFTLESDPFRGRTFAVELRACPNPCCPCTVIQFFCRPENAEGDLVCFDLDVQQRNINSATKPAPEGLALGQAFVAEAQEPQWQWLVDFFMAAKRRQMETMDLDTLPAQFPPEVQANPGAMAGYAEIFPWTESFKFTLHDEEWLVDEQYCVQPDCRCTEAGLSFLRISGNQASDDEPLRNTAFILFNYANGKSQVLERQPGGISPATLLECLLQSHPGIRQSLRLHHEQMKRLAKRLLYPSDRAPAAVNSSGLSPRRATPSPGRNDPCPCGSGKKFKKCCGAN